MRRPSRLAAALLGVGLSLALVAPASGAMTTPRYTRVAEPLATYVPQTTCSPTAKPGVARFASTVMRAYPGTGTFGIVRACSAGGRSEHKEGRAWDWKVNAAVPGQRAAAHDLMRWLFATDSKGVRAANARRVGLMYLIWDRQIWSAYAGGTGWRPYRGANAHTDHMHLSFSWSGARAQTSWFAATPAPVQRALPTPARTAPLPAPRPLPKVTTPQPAEAHDHEGGWRPGRGRAGDDAASRAAARAAADLAEEAARAERAAERAAAKAAERAAREKAKEAARAERTAAEERARAERRAEVEAALRAAHADAAPRAAATAATAAAARTAFEAADAAEEAQEDLRDDLRRDAKRARRGSAERAAAEAALVAAEAELARLRTVEDETEAAWRTAAGEASRAAELLARVLRQAEREGVSLDASAPVPS